MALRTIRIAGDPVLTKKCREITEMTPRIRELIDDMFETMYDAAGVGLAGPQVGILKRICVIDCGDEPYVFINPRIVESDGEQTGDEGCLSLPGITVPITRKTWAKVKYLDLDFRERYIEGDGLLGRCLQHEIDHLDGKTLIESCDPVVRMDVLRQYQAALAAGARPGDTGEEE